MSYYKSNKFNQDIKHNVDDPKYRIKPYQQIFSSCGGALITSLFMTPLDVVKTRIQTQQKVLLSNKCFLYCNGLMDHLCECGPNGTLIKRQIHFTGTVDAFIKISRIEGVSSLWSGLSPTLVLAVPATVIYFVAYEQMRVRMKDYYLKVNHNSKTIPYWIPLIAGMSARVTSVTIVNPLELIRTKMQSQKLNYNQVGVALKDMINFYGIPGLWKGLGATLLRDVPFSGIYWASYESLKNMFEVTNPTFTFSFMAGGLSGCLAALVTTPFDVIKTHKQIELGEKIFSTDKSSKLETKNGTFKALNRIYSSHGVKGLFSGLIPRLIKVSPACAIMIATFEYGKSFFYNYNVQRLLIEEMA